MLQRHKKTSAFRLIYNIIETKWTRVFRSVFAIEILIKIEFLITAK